MLHRVMASYKGKALGTIGDTAALAFMKQRITAWEKVEHF